MRPLLAFCMTILISNFTFDQAGYGRGRLTGLVIDENGNPIPSARIILQFLEHEETRGVGIIASKIVIKEEAVFETMTDKKGRWYFNGLAGGTWIIRASQESYVSAIYTCQVRELSRNKTIELRLEKAKDGYYYAAPDILKKANEYFLMCEYRKALSLYLNYIEKEPEALLVLLVIGDCWRQIGDTKKAIAAYQVVVEMTSDDPIHKGQRAKAFAGIGQCYIDEDDKDNALEYLQLSVQTSQIDEIIAASLGDLLFSMGRTEEAIKSYMIAIQMAPNRGYLQYRLGLFYLNKGDYEHAKACFTRVLELEPSSELATQAQIVINALSKRKA